MWRTYALSRLSSLELKSINEELITSDILNAAYMPFERRLSKMALELPKFKLISILGGEKFAFLFYYTGIDYLRTPYYVLRINPGFY